MNDIEMQDMSPEFFAIWEAAVQHLNNQVDGGIHTWLRPHPYPPFLEHLSFRLGNQLFFVRVEDADAIVQAPGSLSGLFLIADATGGHACILPMKKQLPGNLWVAEETGWGLIDARSRKAVNPPTLVTDENIEMTRWELQDLATQVVRQSLEDDGFEVKSWQGNPDVDPSIWFMGKSQKPEWVVVRAVRYPVREASRPDNWSKIAGRFTEAGLAGHFASVSVASVDQPFEAENEEPLPIWRGHGMHIRYTGLE